LIDLELGFIFFLLAFFRLSRSHFLGHEFDRLIQVDSGHFYFLFNFLRFIFFFQFHHSILGFLISVSWLRLWILRVNFVFYVLFQVDIFLNFILQYLVDLELDFIIYLFIYSFYKVIPVLLSRSWNWRVNLGWLEFFFLFHPSKLGLLIPVHELGYELTRFFCSFFSWFFF
jgi:hypothetical protein